MQSASEKIINRYLLIKYFPSQYYEDEEFERSIRTWKLDGANSTIEPPLTAEAIVHNFLRNGMFEILLTNRADFAPPAWEEFESRAYQGYQPKYLILNCVFNAQDFMITEYRLAHVDSFNSLDIKLNYTQKLIDNIKQVLDKDDQALGNICASFEARTPKGIFNNGLKLQGESKWREALQVYVTISSDSPYRVQAEYQAGLCCIELAKCSSKLDDKVNYFKEAASCFAHSKVPEAKLQLKRVSHYLSTIEKDIKIQALDAENKELKNLLAQQNASLQQFNSCYNALQAERSQLLRELYYLRSMHPQPTNNTSLSQSPFFATSSQPFPHSAGTFEDANFVSKEAPSRT